jgi:hypothetical protein
VPGSKLIGAGGSAPTWRGAEQARLVTLTGAGGAARHAGLEGRACRAVSDGVWWVGLATRPTAFVAQAAHAGCGGPGRPAVAALAERIAARRLLLVLDNCEHLVAACAQIVAWLLRECPGLVVLATSREQLGVAGETVWRVPPLSVLSPQSSVLSGDRQHSGLRTRLGLERAVRSLFVERAQAVRLTSCCQPPAGRGGAFAGNWTECRWHRLAAAWVSPAGRADARRLDRSLLQLLAAAALPRQQTLRAAIT